MDAQGGDAGRTPRVGAPAETKTTTSSYKAKSSELQRAAGVRSIMTWWCPPWRGCEARRALPAVCVAAAAIVGIIVLSAGRDYSPDDLPSSWFTEDDAQGSEPPRNLTAGHLLDGLLTADFSYRSCRSRYEFAGYHKNSSHKPSPYLLAKLRKQEALQRRCGPGTAAHENALRRLNAGESVIGDDDCRYLAYISYRGLGNRMLSITSAFLYAVLTERALLVDGGAEIAALFCEPFPGTTWLLPRPGWWSRSPLRRLRHYNGRARETLGNALRSGGAVAVSADGNLSWAAPRPPPYLYLHLSGEEKEYGFHDKLFFCGAHQRLLRDVPWLFMYTDNYLVPGLFLTPPFTGELEAMFPEKDAAFHHLGRYLFHPTNRVWNAVTSYHRANLAGAQRVVGVQIRVFHEDQPPQAVLEQLLACVRGAGLLPETETTTSAGAATPPPSRLAVLVTSLSPWYYERVREEYGGRIAGGVHQPSHEGQQRWHDAAHDMRALSEVYLLSTCDELVTSGLSTFGYVAQGLAGVRPWVMARAPVWAADWREGLDPEELRTCRRAASVEPCFHLPSAYDCAARRDVELDGVTPYIRRCVDVKWGIKLVNESISQW